MVAQGNRLHFLWMFFFLIMQWDKSQSFNSLEVRVQSKLKVLDLRELNSIRRTLQESKNLQAATPKIVFSRETVAVSSMGSGSFSILASTNTSEAGISPAGQLAYRNKSSSPDSGRGISQGLGKDQSRESGKSWSSFYVIPGAVIFITLFAGMLVMIRAQQNSSGVPWRTGLSGPLQKAFVTGVPKLNRPELEAACEDFSNIVQSFPDCTVFKGTLSSGVEIAVVSTTISSSKQWSKSSQILFEKKIDSLSRINHKNFVNLLGCCEESSPFMRMMVFEYAPNGSLYEHLHVKEAEPLDWATRIRIIMGVAYCLRHMHHDLNPPAVHPCLRSSTIFLTDDYAAKIGEIGFWKEVAMRGRANIPEEELSSSGSLTTQPESNVYDFGLLLLEIISSRHTFDDDRNIIIDWAADFIVSGESGGSVVDPMIDSVKNKELEVICEVIRGCVKAESRRRLKMHEATAMLQEVTGISPETATPRLSPLWWAELELLSEGS